jgi:hypothetical protein
VNCISRPLPRPAPFDGRPSQWFVGGIEITGMAQFCARDSWEKITYSIPIAANSSEADGDTGGCWRWR